jgi:hypothetical protein
MYGMASMDATPSTMAASTTCPRPEVPRSTRAAQMPKAMSIPPPPKSPSRLMGNWGGPPARPRACSAPVRAMYPMSCPAVFASGPSWPHPVIRA